LVPGSGMCDTIEGEMLRAISKIYYDYYNNGFGNFWDKPLAFLKQNASEYDLDKSDLSLLSPYAKGRVFRPEYNSAQGRAMTMALERLTNRVVKHILAKGKAMTPNEEDMWGNNESKRNVSESLPGYKELNSILFQMMLKKNYIQ
jgi:hypothetical protein